MKDNDEIKYEKEICPKTIKMGETRSEVLVEEDDFASDSWGLKGEPNEDEKNSKKGRGRPKKKEKKRNCRNAKNTFPCNIEGCQQGFSRKTFLMRHKFKEHGSLDAISCEDCEETFLNLKQLEVHLQRNHPKWSCETCGEKKLSKIILQNHIDAQHGNGFPCPQCGNVFKTPTSLSYHIATQVHGDHDGLQCIKCDYRTRQAELL